MDFTYESLKEATDIHLPSVEVGREKARALLQKLSAQPPGERHRLRNLEALHKKLEAPQEKLVRPNFQAEPPLFQTTETQRHREILGLRRVGGFPGLY